MIGVDVGINKLIATSGRVLGSGLKCQRINKMFSDRQLRLSREADRRRLLRYRYGCHWPVPVLRQTRAGLGRFGLRGYVQAEQSKAATIFALALLVPNVSQMGFMALPMASTP